MDMQTQVAAGCTTAGFTFLCQRPRSCKKNNKLLKLGGGFYCGLVVYKLDEADGKNDGTIKGQQYFECEPKHGVMVREADVDVLVSA